jgi:hypothetical protein
MGQLAKTADEPIRAPPDLRRRRKEPYRVLPASRRAFSELYTTWHLTNAVRIMNQVTLTTVSMIGY